MNVLRNSKTAVIALLLIACLSFGFGQTTSFNVAGVPRYSVQYWTGPNKPSLYFITDNGSNKLHIYENSATGCVLKQVLDLEQVGQAELIASKGEVAGQPSETGSR